MLQQKQGSVPSPAIAGTFGFNKLNMDRDDESDDVPANGQDLQPPPNEEQDESERRNIRRRYRRIIEEIQESKEELADPSSDALSTKLKEVDELYRPVKKTREAALDSSCLVQIAKIGRLKAQALNTEFVKFVPSEFAEKLVSFVSGQQARDGERIPPGGWERLGGGVQPYFKRAPAYHFMHGSFEPGEIQPNNARVGRKVKEKDDIVGKATIPKQLQDFSETDRNEATTAEVEKIHNILIEQYNNVGRQPICYFEFIVNPDSFGQTVENVFYTSFLIRDGYAQIFLDADKLPVIQPVGELEGEVQPEQNERRKQVIISITPQMYRDICQTFEITTPLIPTRPTHSRGK